MQFKIYKFKTVTSTNDLAADLIKKKKKEAGYVYAETQSKGKGTYGKKWISDKGNHFGSIFFPLKKEFPPFHEFSIINSVIVSDIISYFCKKQKTTLKFPNDVYVNGKKICGILQENIVLNRKNFLIIGIGINIVSNPIINNKYGTTNILSETKKKPKMNEVVSSIINAYKEFFINLHSYDYNYFKKKAEAMAL